MSNDLFYQMDLAYVHDKNFGQVASSAFQTLIPLLPTSGNKSIQIVDLGCGSGILARLLSEAGFSYHGIDYSLQMIQLAKQKAPNATFEVGSFLDVQLPPCYTILSIGECLNYVFDERNGPKALTTLFEKIHAALQPQGIFMFDIIEPGIGGSKRIIEKDDWTMFLEITEDSATQMLTREIMLFRKINGHYRKSKEKHLVHLYPRKTIKTILLEIGFQVKLLTGYGNHKFREHCVGFLARK